MVVEMLALLFAPMNGSEYVFLLFALNRIVSGLAEAAVSGADEALAYDSSKKQERKRMGVYSKKAQRYTSLAFFFAMMTGSAFYDSSFINLCLSFIGVDYSFTPEALVKAPIFLTFLSSLVVLVAALGMKEQKLRPKVKRHWKPCGNHLALSFSRLMDMEDSSSFWYSFSIHGSRQCNSSIPHHCKCLLECD